MELPISQNNEQKQCQHFFFFLLHQACADDEAASTRLLQICLFRLLFTASLMFIPCAFRSFFTSSIHAQSFIPIQLMPNNAGTNDDYDNDDHVQLYTAET